MGIRFEGDLELSGEGRRATITGNDEGHLVVTTDELAPLLSLLPGGAAPLGTLRAVASQLADAGATVHLRTTEQALLTVGAESTPGAISRLARLDHVQVESARGLAVAARPGLRRAVPVAAAVAAAAAVATVIRRRR